MTKEELQVNFRMPASLKKDLEEMAKRNRRSLTAEVVARLEKSITDDGEELYPGISEPEPSGAHLVTPSRGISKDRLLANQSEEEPVTKRDLDTAVMDAMLRALDMLDPRDRARLQNQPTKGPAPRKKYPKQ